MRCCYTDYYLFRKSIAPDSVSFAGDLTPGLFGVIGELSPTGSSSYVDTHDSSGPLVLMVGAPGTRAVEWAAVQALMERNGVGSVVLVPPGPVWHDHLRTTVDSLLDRWGRTGRPLVSVTFGRALDSLLVATPVGHSLRGRRLSAIAPGRPEQTGIKRWLARLPATIRPVAAPSDVRLASWGAPVLVLRATDDDQFGERDAARLASSAGQSRVGVLPGGGFSSAPQHPADDAWRELIEFILGRTRYQDAVMQPDSVLLRDTVVAIPSNPPARAIPSLQRPR